MAKRFRITKKAIGRWVLIILSVFLVSFAVLPDREFQIVRNLDIFFNLFRELNLYYVDETNPEELINSSIEGMLGSLDPYTTFIPESAMEDYKSVTTGQYGGIGASIRNIDNNITIVDLSRNYPADKSGIKAGDIIVKIDKEYLIGKNDTDISELLKGTPGTKTELLIKQAKTGKEVTKSLTREIISVPNVPYYGTIDHGETGYIRLSNFSTNAGKEVRDALLALKKENVKSVVLDIRNNPGGLLIEAVEVVNVFVKRGQEVVSTRGRIKQWDNIYTTRHEPVDTIIPLVVVVNRSSASASEIVAGAIQDLDRGVVVGQRTFGKGLVQTTRQLSYNTQLKVTTAKYYIPSGRCIQALDYSHREPDGSVGYIPDSLIREYKTLKNKRTVRDGGGVAPDIEVTPKAFSRITVALYLQNFIFKYATVYSLQHDTIPFKNFGITDKDYDGFVSYLKSHDFDYQTETESSFAKLKESARRERYWESAEPEFDALQTKLAHDRFKDLEVFKDEIKDLLNEEISARYYYSAGRISASIAKDAQIEMALDMLKDSGKYRQLLGLN